MTWVFVITGDCYDIKRGEWRANANSLLSAQEFWFAVFMTVLYVLSSDSLIVTDIYSVLIPWVTLREVPVEVEIPSPKVAILRFQRGMQQGLLGRISRTSIMEYHAFGLISEGRKADCHYMICGVQGDFTKSLVANPPKTVWTRQLKFGMSCDTYNRRLLTYHSWRRTRISNVQARHPHLHRHRNRGSAINMHPKPRLVLHLDRLGSRKNLWTHHRTTH